MSRPFSYNDDNFTVIGNVLFAHILTKPIPEHTKICVIPPEIAKRLIQLSAQGVMQSPSASSGGIFYGAIRKEDGKYYILNNIKIDYTYYLMFYLMLKDI